MVEIFSLSGMKSKSDICSFLVCRISHFLFAVFMPFLFVVSVRPTSEICRSFSHVSCSLVRKSFFKVLWLPKVLKRYSWWWFYVKYHTWKGTDKKVACFWDSIFCLWHEISTLWRVRSVFLQIFPECCWLRRLRRKWTSWNYKVSCRVNIDQYMFYKDLQEGTLWYTPIISIRIQSKVTFLSIQQVTEYLLIQLLLCLIHESHSVDRDWVLRYLLLPEAPGSPNHCEAEKDEKIIFITSNLVSNHFCTIQLVVGKEWCHLQAAHWRTQNWAIPHLEESTGIWFMAFWHLTINKSIYSSFSVWFNAASIWSQKSAQRCHSLDILTLME